MRPSYDLVKGVSDGCVMSECALVGGETAEMPGFYKEGEYDIAGFAVGIVDKDKIINGKNIKPGDKLIGIASSLSLLEATIFTSPNLAASLAARFEKLPVTR